MYIVQDCFCVFCDGFCGISVADRSARPPQLQRFIQRPSFGLDPQAVFWAVDGLKLTGSDVPVPFDAAVDRGRAAALTMREAEPALTRQEAGAKGGRGNKALAHEIKLSTSPTSPERIASRLKRDHPDIAAAVERGEFASMRQAGIAAG